ncbi:MAG TPA: hypothetical protein VL359_09020, partial [bacterium]|nr:hypothetical protein [bacterium]
TVLAILTELAGTVFGGKAQASVSLQRGPGAPSLRMRVTTGSAWEGLQGDDVSAVAFRSGVRAGSVVDLLYVQKIVELQGGSLGFHRREGQVYGFELHWPCG